MDPKTRGRVPGTLSSLRSRASALYTTPLCREVKVKILREDRPYDDPDFMFTLTWGGLGV